VCDDALKRLYYIAIELTAENEKKEMGPSTKK
jgi:hypothetical protein